MKLRPFIPTVGKSGGIVTSNLLAWWRHSKGSGLVLEDHHNSYDGNINAVESEFWLNSGPDGSPVGTYDGTDDDVNEIGTGLAIASGGMSIVAAVYFASVGGTSSTILSRAETSNWNYALYTKNSTDEFNFIYKGLDNNNQVWTSSNFNIVANTWYIITVTFTFGTGSSIKMYKNLTEVSGSWSAGNGNQLPKTANMYVHVGSIDNVGDDSGAQIPMNGRMGDILPYSKSLSLSEITQNYNYLKSRYGL